MNKPVNPARTENAPAPTGGVFARIVVSLRSPEERYLRHCADLGVESVSSVFRSIVDRYGAAGPVPQPSARKSRQCIAVTESTLSTIDRLAVEWGVDRSEVSRRLIDRAQKDDPIILS